MIATTEELDELDLQLLDALQRNARSTFAELGSFVGLQGAGGSRPGEAARAARVHPQRYSAQLDAKRLGLELTAFV